MAESNDENAKEKEEIKERKEELRELSDVYKRRAMGEPNKPENEEFETTQPPLSELEDDQLTLEVAMRLYDQYLERARQLARDMVTDMEASQYTIMEIHTVLETTESMDIRYGVKGEYSMKLPNNAIKKEDFKRVYLLYVPYRLKEVLNKGKM